MNKLYSCDCLDVLKEMQRKYNINLEVPNWHHNFACLGEMLTFKTITKQLDTENGVEELF